jgi:hypothetical protein
LAKALESWADLSEFLLEQFHEPDLEAVRVSLAVGISHYYLQDKPVWLLLIGPPATGKTTIVMEGCLPALSRVHILDELTPSTLLSGYTKNGRSSFLSRVGKDGILLFPDFTVFASGKWDVKTQISGQLRKVYDGHYSREIGVGGKTIQWRGKITLIAATTEEGERQWSVMRALGERFMHLRWPRGDGLKVARAAHNQLGHTAEIQQEILRLTTQFLDLPTISPLQATVNPDDYGLTHLAEMVSILRGHVVREAFTAKREIISKPEPEQATRILTAMGQVTRAHATLFRRDISEQDVRAAIRLAKDTIPPNRRRIVQAMVNYPEDGQWSRWAFLLRITRLAPSALNWSLDELQALEVIRCEQAVEKQYTFTDEFQELIRGAGCF